MNNYIELKTLPIAQRIELARKSEPFFLAYKKDVAFQSSFDVISSSLPKEFAKKHEAEIWTLISATTQTIRYDSDTCQLTMDKNNYTTANAITKKRIDCNRMKDLVDLLCEMGLVTFYKGFHLPDTSKGKGKEKGVEVSMRSLISFSEDWYAMFDVLMCKRQGTARVWDYVILKDKNGKVVSHKGMRGIGQEKALLKEWNSLLDSTLITIDNTKVTPTYTTVFNNGSLECGGRMYAGSFSTERSELRETITINNNLTCEVDYKNNHIRILYNEYGIDYQEDAYTIELFEGVNKDDQRLAAKYAMLIMLNAKSRRQANLALEGKLKSKELECSKAFVKHLFDGLKNKHSVIASHFFCAEWDRLQNIDSKMAKHVVKAFTAMGVAVLTYHDSFVCESKHKDKLIEVMQESWEIVLGDAKGFGYDVEFCNEMSVESTHADIQHTLEQMPLECYTLDTERYSGDYEGYTPEFIAYLNGESKIPF